MDFRSLLSSTFLCYLFLLPPINASTTRSIAAELQQIAASDGRADPLAIGIHDIIRGRKNKILHPPTGLCLVRGRLTEPLNLGPCDRAASWEHTPQKLLVAKGTYYCLQATRTGSPIRLSIICDPSDSAWYVVAASNTATHLVTKLADGTTLCLEFLASQDGKTSSVVSNACKYPTDDGQWFKIVAEYPGNGH